MSVGNQTLRLPDGSLIRDRRRADRSRLGARDYTLRRLLAAGDLVAVLAALAIALGLDSHSSRGHNLVWGLVVLPAMVLLFKLYGLYDRDVKRISHSTVDDLPWVFHAAVGGALVLWLYSKFSPLHRLDFIEVLSFGVLTIVFVIVVRWLVRATVARMVGPEVTLLVGGGQMAHVLVAKLDAHPEYKSKVLGVLDDAQSPQPPAHDLPVLGRPDQLGAVAAQHSASRVIVSATDLDDEELEELLRRCRALALKVSVLPKLSDVLGPAVEIDDVEGVTVLGVNPPWLPRSSRALKRALDIALAAGLLLVAAPLMILVAIAIKLDSRGPVFFAQERVGKAGRRFRLFKFRTMVADAEQLRAGLLERSHDPNWLHLDHDPRITPVGHLLRRLSLDELPQLFNVLRGQMSMVGPRPLIEAEDERVVDWARGRLDLTPGITGYWQVLGRTRIPFEEMVKLDYLYVMNWSLWGDLRLILRTLPAVLGGRGAN